MHLELAFPGFDEFDPTAPLMHAIFTLREAIPAGCESIRAEFDQQGAAFVMGDGPDGGPDIVLHEDQLGAAGFLLTYISTQVIQLTKMLERKANDTRTEEEVDEDIEEAQQRLAASLRASGLSIGLLEEPVGEGEDIDFADSLTIFRS